MSSKPLIRWTQPVRLMRVQPGSIALCRYILKSTAQWKSPSPVLPLILRTLAGLARGVCTLVHVRLEGLMTMGPLSADDEEVRAAFRNTRHLFDRLRDLDLPGVCLDTLSMGMTDSYRIAIEEGSTMVRPGAIVFGPR